jgi:hypothetical protein
LAATSVREQGDEGRTAWPSSGSAVDPMSASTFLSNRIPNWEAKLSVSLAIL